MRCDRGSAPRTAGRWCLLGCAWIFAVAAGCQPPDSSFGAVDSPTNNVFTVGTGGSGTGTTGAGGGTTAPPGVPCDVAQALTVCVGCHADPPVNGAIGSLVTYADLTGPAPTDATQTMAQMAVTRMNDAAAPMPPSPLPPASAAQIQAVSAWVAAGTPMGTCESTFAGSPTCPSGSYFTGDTHSGGTMYPGRACVSCHAQNGGPNFQVGGTVFPTGKVLDDCLPSASVDLTAAQVVLHDANGDHALTVLPDGNFRSYASQGITFPFTAKVVYQGRERAMVAAQTSGDCNACHTASGAQGAPGRIALP